MYKALSSYQFFKYIESSISNDKNTLILEPLCVIYRLALLQYKEHGTKLSIKNNAIQYQEPSVIQGMLRSFLGDCREDLHNLYHPILKSIDWYSYNEYQPLYDECIIGLKLLNDVYDNNSIIRHTIYHYISVIEMNDNENYKKNTKFNPIIDSLRDIWTNDEIISANNLLRLIKTNKNKNTYIDSLETILNSKEESINKYIHRISTSY